MDISKISHIFFQVNIARLINKNIQNLLKFLLFFAQVQAVLNMN